MSIDIDAKRTTLQRDSVGRVTTILYQSGLRQLSSYDLAGQQATGRADFGGADISDRFTYTYDPVGNRTVIEDGGQKTTFTFTYDAKSRLTKAEASGAIGYEHDYSYDSCDNRLTASEPVLTTYTYDLAGQIVTSLDAGDFFITYTYDQNGSLSALAGTIGMDTWATAPTFAYDKERRLISYNGEGLSATMAYNGDGLKVGQNSAVHLWDGLEPLGQATGGGAMNVHTYSVEGMVLGEKHGTRHDYGHDALGSVIATTDQTGSGRLSSSRYKPYGGGLFQAGPTLPWQWVGTLGYRATGIAYMEQYVRARHYGATQASWLTVDPLWPRVRRYGYVNNMPTLRDDRTGLIPGFHISGFPVGDISRWWECLRNPLSCIPDFPPPVSFPPLPTPKPAEPPSLPGNLAPNFGRPDCEWGSFPNYGRFCGKCTGSSVDAKPLDCVDAACKEHDFCVLAAQDWKHRDFCYYDCALRNCDCLLARKALACFAFGCLGNWSPFCRSTALLVYSYFNAICISRPPWCGEDAGGPSVQKGAPPLGNDGGYRPPPRFE